MTALSLHDETDFAALVERHRRELQVHCYRMLGSFDESEDALQETFLRAWRGRATYAGRASLRAWLYRIATTTCLDVLDRRPRRPSPDGEILWLQPFPDSLLDEVAADDDVDAEIVARETIELAFMVAIQHLPPRSRAVLIARDVLGWRAKETAELLGMSVAAVNSALQRARAGLKEHLPERRVEWPTGDPDAQERALINRYVEACERGDAALLTDILHDDLRFSMPPDPGVWTGRENVVNAWVTGGFGAEDFGELRLIETRVNRLPALANYHRKPGEGVWRALAVDVLTIADGRVIDITAFHAPVFPSLGLPAEL
jgi:RNA polymerase sigma-70 factor (TIGR02960 family)